MAVKIIHERFAQHPEWLQLFHDEAKLSYRPPTRSTVELSSLQLPEERDGDPKVS